MRKIVSLLILLSCSSAIANAQTFLDRLRQKQPGRSTVTVTQNKAIDDLINGKVPETTPKATPSTATTAPKPAETTSKPAETQKEDAKKEAGKSTENAKKPENESPKKEENEETVPLELHKKVMLNSYKVDGYRVQAYAGSNTRAARQRAESVRNAIKKKFPNQPVYVHFYSPRWICRVGNYRNYEEAAWMLKQLKGMGYRSAIIVKGKITVQY